MTPLQSNKAAPNKNNNKKKNFPHIKKKKKNRQFLILSGINFRRKYFIWKILLKPNAYKIKPANKK